MSQQIDDQLPEKPQIAVILRTDDCRTLEKKIHDALKEQNIEDAIGKEWFLTAPIDYQRISERIDV